MLITFAFISTVLLCGWFHSEIRERVHWESANVKLHAFKHVPLKSVRRIPYDTNTEKNTSEVSKVIVINPLNVSIVHSKFSVPHSNISSSLGQNTEMSSDFSINSVDCSQREFLVFACLKNRVCSGGWGDRLKAIISTYLLAELTNRTFVILYTNPCELTQFLVPSLYNWNRCQEYIMSLPKLEKSIISSYNRNRTFPNYIKTLDVSHPLKHQVLYTYTNQIWIEYILDHPKAAQRLPWAVGKTVSEISGQILKRLFRPSTLLENEIIKFKENITKPRQMICSHIRVGRNPTIPNDGRRRFGAPDVNVIFEFLRKFDNPSKYVIYVATDSQNVKDSVRGNFTSVVTVDMPIVHIAKHRQDTSGCVGFYMALLEQLILSRCDLLLLTHSGYGAMAAYMSTIPQEIYIFYKNQRILKINRHEMYRYFRHTELSKA